MLYIAHRINTLEQLVSVPDEYGVELDLRDRAERLILQHDPFIDGEDAEPYFAKYKKQTIILNVKSERIEAQVLELMNKYGITDFFFLDSSIPMIVSLLKQGEKRTAVRYSEFESLDTVLKFAGKVEWVWIDCFSRLNFFGHDEFATLKKAGFKTCLVSPELQGRAEDIEGYKIYLAEQGIVFDAICTKLANIPRWKA